MKELTHCPGLIDEDFWYMCGRKGTICMSADNVQQQAAWPCTSIFHLHSSGALNETLSQTVREIGEKDFKEVECLEKILYRDPQQSRQEFFKLRKTQSTLCSDGNYLCCECRAKQCDHYDDVLYVFSETRQYFKDTCSSCVFKLARRCERFWNCFIECMVNQKVFTNVSEAVLFENNCFHFQYEHAYR